MYYYYNRVRASSDYWLRVYYIGVFGRFFNNINRMQARLAKWPRDIQSQRTGTSVEKNKKYVNHE